MSCERTVNTELQSMIIFKIKHVALNDIHMMNLISISVETLPELEK